MAEVAAASSVGGLLSLTIQVIQISQKYISAVRSSSKTIKGYFRELEIMRLVLEDLQVSSKDESSHLKIDVSALTACSEELEQLHSKLCKRISSSSRMTHLNRLTWPFAEDETRRLTEILHRYQSSLHVMLSSQSHRLTATTLAAIEIVSSRQERDIRERIVGLISVADPLINHVAARNKHEPATGDWMLQSAELSQWWNGSSSTLWIRSIPGAGKTILCSTIIDRLVHTQNADDFILYFYFDFRDEGKQRLGSLLRSFIAQICVRADHIPEEIRVAFEKGVSLDNRSLTSLLSDLILLYGNVKIVIDALDESSERQLVLSFLQDLTEKLSGAVQWLVTSRREQDIEAVLNECATTIVSLSKDVVDADIRLHIDSCLRRDRILSSRPAWVKQEIMETLVAKADGMFQYVECQLSVLRNCLTGPAIESALASLPAGIDETYDRILLRIAPENWGCVQRTLSWLAFSMQPLRIQEIAEAAVLPGPQKPFDPTDRLFDPMDVVSLAGGLVLYEEASEVLVLAHYSIQEYLFSHRIREGPARYFALEEQRAHHDIALDCITYMLSVSDLTTGYHGITQDYPLLEYGSRYWLEHAYPSLKAADTEILKLTIHVVDGRKGAHRFWLAYHDHERRNRSPLQQLLASLDDNQLEQILKSPGFAHLPRGLLWHEMFEMLHSYIMSIPGFGWNEETNSNDVSEVVALLRMVEIMLSGLRAVMGLAVEEQIILLSLLLLLDTADYHPLGWETWCSCFTYLSAKVFNSSRPEKGQDNAEPDELCTWLWQWVKTSHSAKRHYLQACGDLKRPFPEDIVAHFRQNLNLILSHADWRYAWRELSGKTSF